VTALLHCNCLIGVHDLFKKNRNLSFIKSTWSFSEGVLQVIFIDEVLQQYGDYITERLKGLRVWIMRGALSL